MRRQGHDVWRYSDDFRIGCHDYPHALAVIETLAEEARHLGLILNEAKLATPKFLGYFSRNAETNVVSASDDIDPDDVEASVISDYSPDDDEGELSMAEEAISRIGPVKDELDELLGIEPELVPVDEMDVELHASVRRALNILSKHSDSRGLVHALDLLALSIHADRFGTALAA